jgi:hypothetical protein
MASIQTRTQREQRTQSAEAQSAEAQSAEAQSAEAQRRRGAEADRSRYDL